jgi:PIN domain nuclease of toxin-antitoxin system
LRVLLDTQVFLEFAQRGIERFGPRARKLIEDEDSDLLFSAVSITEIAIKANIKKLGITASDASKAFQDLRLILIPFEPRHAMLMFDLPLHHSRSVRPHADRDGAFGGRPDHYPRYRVQRLSRLKDHLVNFWGHRVSQPHQVRGRVFQEALRHSGERYGAPRLRPYS